MPGVLWTSVHMTTWVGSGGDSNIFWEAAVYSVWFFKVIMLRSEKREIQALLIETSSSMKIRQFSTVPSTLLVTVAQANYAERL